MGVVMSRKDFTEHIKKRREALGLTQPQIAEAMGYTQQYITRWEQGGVKHVTEDHVRRWARVLQDDAGYLRRLLGSDAPVREGSGRDRTVAQLLRIPEIADGPERRLIQRFAEALLENQGAALLAAFRQWEHEVAGEVGEDEEQQGVKPVAR